MQSLSFDKNIQSHSTTIIEVQNIFITSESFFGPLCSRSPPPCLLLPKRPLICFLSLEPSWLLPLLFVFSGPKLWNGAYFLELWKTLSEVYRGKMKFICLLLHCVKEVDFFFKFEIFITPCLNTKPTCRALRGTWILKVVFLPGSSRCSPARAARCLRKEKQHRHFITSIESVVSVKASNQNA